MKYNLVLVIIFLAIKVVASTTNNDTKINYPFWPSYKHLKIKDLDTIVAQKWIEQDHVINGWDWSLPNFVEPAPNSFVGLQRIIGLKKAYEPLNLKFKCNSVGILWVKWRDVEPEMGNYNFQPVINRIMQAKNAGSDIILRFLCHSYSRKNDADSLSRGDAPLWLKDLGVPFLTKDFKNRPSDNLNFDPSNPAFHDRYLKFVEELGKTNIPNMVKAAYVGYASHSFGDEGIGPHGENNPKANDLEKHVRERLDAWENIFPGMTHKVFMGGVSYYGFDKGFGTRRGFVEMYMYRIPNNDMGQYVDRDNYLNVDENSPVLANSGFHGEVNEEYEDAWATADRNFRFGTSTESFPYRYFVSTLRALQMRCTYIHTTGHLIPKMLPFLSQELARTVNDAPDVWSFLNTSYLKEGKFTETNNKGVNLTNQNEGVEVKNFERWLYQRDAPGYETQPAIKINQAIKMWMIKPDKYYDYIGRKGQKIGFDIDDRWLKQNDKLAIKVSYIDNMAGELKLCYNNNLGGKSQILNGDLQLKTVTFFVNELEPNSMKNGFDFTIESGNSTSNIVVSMVRVVRASENPEVSIESTQQTSSKQVIAYPTPLKKGELNLNFTDPNIIYTLSVMDMNGKVIMLKKNISRKFSISRGLFDQKGIYILKIKSTSNLESIKFSVI